MIEDHLNKNTLKIIVKPNSNKTQIIKWDKEKKALRINVKSPPQKGKANIEIVKFFTKLLKKKVLIKSGLSSKEKILQISQN
jgi:uncharacterized protein